MLIAKPLSDAIDAIPEHDPDHPQDHGTLFLHARRDDPEGPDTITIDGALDRARAAASASLAADGFGPDQIRAAISTANVEGTQLLDGNGDPITED